MVKIVAHGIIIDDIVFPDGQTKMGILGGGGPQTAWGAAAAFGDGSEAGIIAGIHSDEPDEILAPMTAAGINIDGIRRNDLATPRAWQILEYDGLRRHMWRSPMNVLPEQLKRGWSVAPASYHDAEWFHWGMHPGDDDVDIAMAKELVSQGKKVCLEPYIPSPEPLTTDHLHRLLAPCKVFSANIHEITNITGYDDDLDLIRYIMQVYNGYLLIRRDENGADVWNLATERGIHVPAVKADVVDVVGAGNAFTGAFLAAIHTDLVTAASTASAAAAYMIEQVGMPESLPNPTDFAHRVGEAAVGITPLKLKEM